MKIELFWPCLFIRLFLGTPSKDYTYAKVYRRMTRTREKAAIRLSDGAYDHVQNMLTAVTSPVTSRDVEPEGGRQCVAGINVMRT